MQCCPAAVAASASLSVRTLIAGAGIARVFFCTLVGRRIVMLHSFIKKSARTPSREREVAETRMKEIKRANT